ncbi:MAG: cysteinyl-tRNA synthetase [Chloroflexi bacterium]|nr:cysteinyl-tRNA synthetase [Chloroflexota bacterium]MDL1943273.1 cysteinyl-tRNA synthetase [Chloroflexi bacterium CFX2]
MTLGRIAFLGSGETSLAGGRIFETLARLIPDPLRIAILETPAGFELNASLVAGRVGDFLKTRLQNYKPTINLIPARKKGTEFSPDNPDILKPLMRANMIFMGPGSPSYLARQLRGTLAWDVVRARHRQGATLVFASAATISVGQWVLPVYEIYKVGEDVHVKDGLGFFSDFGMHVSFVPHWNNAEGGVDLDTSRCFIGMERFEQWRKLTPAENIIVGLDEHSGIIMDCEKGVCGVHGVSSVSVLKNGLAEMYPSGASFSLSELGTCTPPDPLETGIRPEVWQMILDAQAAEEEDQPSEEVLALLEQRKQARAEKDFAASDRLRAEIAALGWRVKDTKDGQQVERA